MCLSGATCAAQEKVEESADKQLTACVKGGDAGCVARALAAGASANAVDKDDAALTLAAEGKSAAVVKLLLSAGAEANGRPGKSIPLCRAAQFGLEEMAETLLGAGAKVNVVCDGHGDTPLMKALLGATMTSMPDGLKEGITKTGGGDGEGDESGGAGAVEELSDEDKALVRVMGTPREKFAAVARMLLARGAGVNVVASCEVGETPLMYAAWAADVEMVKELLSRGAKVDKGVSALAWLAEIEGDFGKAKGLALPALSKEQTASLEWIEKTEPARQEIKRLLRAAGAKEPERGDGETGETDAENLEETAHEAFKSTIERNDLKDLERLSRAYAGHPLGASALAGALRTAVIYERPQMVKLLLAWGADPNAGRLRPLADAAREGEAEMVLMLLEAGADVNAVDEEGRTALDCAESWAGSSGGHDEVIELLKARGAKSGKRK